MASSIVNDHTNWSTSTQTTEMVASGLTVYSSNDLNDKEDHGEDLTDIIYSVAMFIMSFTGILGNLMVIGAVFVHKKLRIVSNAFIVNLAVADLIICFIADTFGIVGVYTKGKLFKNNPVLCDFLGCLCVTSCCCSLWSITAIAVNRYVCICHHFYYPGIFNRRTVPFMIAGLWLLSFIIDIPALTGWGDHNYAETILYCTYDYMSNYSYSVFLMIWQFAIPVSILSYAYIRILLFSRAIKKALRRMQESDIPNGQQIAVTDLRLLRSVLVIWIVFCALWTPYTILLLIKDVTHLPRLFFVCATGLAHLSSSTNSVIYGLTNKNFREGYVILLKKLRPCSLTSGNRQNSRRNDLNASQKCSTLSTSQNAMTYQTSTKLSIRSQQKEFVLDVTDFESKDVDDNGAYPDTRTESMHDANDSFESKDVEGVDANSDFYTESMHDANDSFESKDVEGVDANSDFYTESMHDAYDSFESKDVESVDANSDFCTESMHEANDYESNDIEGLATTDNRTESTQNLVPKLKL